MILMKGLRFEMFKKHQPGQKRVNEMMQKLQHFWTEKVRKSWFYGGKQRPKS
jgi:hypothetical protein